MKHSRILTAVAASAVVVGTTFAGAGMATAAPDSADATWVNSTDDLGQETNAGYPATGWFYGDTAPAVSGTATFGPSGVTLAGGTTQLLTGTTEPGADLENLVTSADFISSGDVDFQIPLFTNTTGEDTGFTTLRPADFGSQDFTASGQWTTSNALGGFAAGSTHSIAEYESELSTLADSEIIGYGFLTPAGSTGTVTAVQFGGDTTYFTPDPEGTYQPTSSTVSEVSTDGIHVIGSGFFPGETIAVGFVKSTAQSGGPIDGLTITADENGAVDEQLVIPASAVSGAGTYRLVLIGETSGIALSNDYTVTADPSAPATPAPTPPAQVPTPVRAAATFAG